MTVDFSKGLVPAIVQDAKTGRVLMLGYMDEAAYQKTIRDKCVTFFSRSKNRLWTKGETSGHFLDLVSIHEDCDHDALLVLANPHGHTCHKGTASCFADAEDADCHVLAHVLEIARIRNKERPERSYTTTLFNQGAAHIGDKVMEEAEEVARAVLEEGHERTASEAADLMFHLIVLLEAAEVPWQDVLAELKKRQGKPGRTAPK
ncbi:MAG: bifunctional phosphoribosyl-AMP cyclohydrolase/phosphoribosyl-ATP diphosphatase [Deltaproteobacteria bacterium CG11_big_fil_rev_8_21_14_0_20_47_16]|nr:MAG: bifunctional phosphoribosyl-AMP cyclohydrolase/phosphoribosyl-ATP diphosphatase [Deltaproteobacteria bacterium CG11_big_fil_rev_8_21_14_0_20_47_16]